MKAVRRLTDSLFYFCERLEAHQHTVLLSSAYLPPVSYFYFLLKYEWVNIEQFETYPKQTFRNRCEIMSGNGKLSLTIPVSKPQGNRTTSKDILIDKSERWQQNHWRAITSAYLNSPYFEFYQDEIEAFYKGNFDSLLQFNEQLMNCICEIIGIQKEFAFTTSYDHSPGKVLDLRSVISPKKEMKREHFPEYIQVFSTKLGFIPNLTIIDLLFNFGPETLVYLKSIKSKINET